MKKIHYSLFSGILLLLLLSSSTRAQPGDMPPNAEDGRCYGKVKMPDEFETVEVFIPEYYGEDSTIIEDYTIFKTIIIKVAGEYWEQRKADKGCVSPDPKDCMVWCLKKQDEESIDIEYYLTDTTVTNEYEVINYPIERHIRVGGYSEWREIVCDKDVNIAFSKRVRAALSMSYKGYNSRVDTEVKEELAKYQREHGLPVGQLDYETLEHMGIDW